MINNDDSGISVNGPKVNLSLKVLEDIGDSWVAASTSFREGNMKDWFKNLKCITLNTGFFLDDKQKERLNRIEIKINRYLEKIKPIGIQYPSNNRLINYAINTQVAKYIGEYNNTIKQCLYDANFLFLTKTDQKNKKSDM